MERIIAPMSFLISSKDPAAIEKKVTEILKNRGLVDVVQSEATRIEEIRELQKLIALGQSVVFKSAQNLTIAAQNALLKTLEEPPENTVIILCTSSPDKLLSTVVSRCVVINIPSEINFQPNQEFDQILEWIEEGSVEIGFSWAEKNAKDRTEAINLLQQLQISGHQKLLKKAVSPNVVSKILLAQKYLQANTNVRLTLENLFLRV